MFEKQAFKDYVGVSSGSSYATGLTSVESVYNVDIDAEYEKDKCASLLSLLDSAKKEAIHNETESHKRRDRYSHLKKYVEFKEVVANSNKTAFELWIAKQSKKTNSFEKYKPESCKAFVRALEKGLMQAGFDYKTACFFLIDDISEVNYKREKYKKYIEAYDAKNSNYDFKNALEFYLSFLTERESLTKFTWIPFYEELATKLLAYKNNRIELLKIIKLCYEELPFEYPFKERGEDEYDDIDPFTIFGTFNKSMRDENRIEIAKKYKEVFSVDADIPKDFTGIPVLMPLSAWFFAYKENRNKNDIDNLWHLCETAIKLADGDETKEQEFIDIYNQVITQRQVKWNITIGLYWIRPNSFLSLDSVSRNYLPVFNPPVGGVVAEHELPDGEKYLWDVKEVKKSFSSEYTMAKSFYELSQQAFEYADRANDEPVKSKILDIIEEYKKNFTKINDEERYKWEAVKHYQDNWNINAPDFAKMLEESFAKTYNLLAAGQYYPLKMLKVISTEHPEEVRELFRILYDESVPLSERFDDFRSGFDEFVKKDNLSHYQDLHAVSVYLTLEYPEKYYFYKYGVWVGFLNNIGEQIPISKGKHETFKIESSNKLCDDILRLVVEDAELCSMSTSRLDNVCYSDRLHRMLAFDIMFFGSTLKNNKFDGWWPTLEEYNPELTKEDWKKYIIEIELPDHPCPMSMLKAMMELGGEASCKNLVQKFGGTVSGYVGCAVNLGKRVKKYFNLQPCMDGEQERYFPFPFFGKAFDDEDGHQYVYRIRPELFAALKEIDLSDISPYYDEDGEEMNNTNIAKNTILYGPPGTGKTYNAVCYAVAIVENKPIEKVMTEALSENGYAEVFKKYNEYKNQGLIAFSTFHQSYGYEEFIEGIKPVMDADDDEQSDIKYSVTDGVFKEFCENATSVISVDKKTDIGLNNSPSVWKVSLWATGDNHVRTECLENGHIRIGWDYYGPDITSETDFSACGGRNVLNSFLYKMKVGDIVLSCYSSTTVDAVGIVTGDYEWSGDYEELNRVRKVNWLVKGINEDIFEMNNNTVFTLPTVYKTQISVADALSIVEKHSDIFNERGIEQKNRVFIIDEINRGNISKIFGELITLIEPSKRLGAKEETKAILPYSKSAFGVPDNVYILGTMNTADRSIAALDTALRRRFDFVEMMPDTDVLSDVDVDGISISKMLKKINERIEVLFDREHTIGHAYFIDLKDDDSVDALADIFRNKVIPLLQEYFYEDYERIRLVLADNQVTDKNKQFIIADDVRINDLFGTNDIDILEDSKHYSINSEAFKNKDAYIKIYDK